MNDPVSAKLALDVLEVSVGGGDDNVLTAALAPHVLIDQRRLRSRVQDPHAMEGGAETLGRGVSLDTEAFGEIEEPTIRGGSAVPVDPELR